MSIGSIQSEVYISIIIPVYNDLKLLKTNLHLLDEYLKKYQSFEIIVVDDGSKNQIEIIDYCNLAGVKCITLKKNQGKGAALRSGFLASKGKFQIFTDVDIPFGFEILDNFIFYLDFKEFDIVVGDRTLSNSNYYNRIKKIRSLGSKALGFLIQNFVAGGFPDTQCGLKGFRKEIAFKLFSVSKINRFAIDVEILYLAIKENYDIKRLSVLLKNNTGKSVHPFRDGIKLLIDCFRIIYYFKTKKYNLQLP